MTSPLLPFEFLVYTVSGFRLRRRKAIDTDDNQILIFAEQVYSVLSAASAYLYGVSPALLSIF